MSHQPHHPHQPNHLPHNLPNATREAQLSTVQTNLSAGLSMGKHEEPISDRIRLRAYEISQSRNGGPGDAMADWIEAEQDVTALRVPKR